MSNMWKIMITGTQIVCANSFVKIFWQCEGSAKPMKNLWQNEGSGKTCDTPMPQTIIILPEIIMLSLYVELDQICARYNSHNDIVDEMLLAARALLMRCY